MPLSDPFKLEKLKIRAYRDRERRTLVKTFEAMFNPASFEQRYEVTYAPAQSLNSSGSPARFTMSKPQRLDLELLLDGSGVEAIGLLAPLRRSVRTRLKEFLDTAYELDGSTHEPHFLVVEWGDDLSFSCRLRSATATYTSFDRAGNPLRAKLNLQLVSDATAATRAAKDNLMSPDVTHTRTVSGSDSVALLANEVYGSVDHYLFVASANGLDHFRELVPGQELRFPPLEPQ